MNKERSLAIAQIVSAIIAKDFKVSGLEFEEYASEVAESDVDVWDYERVWSSTDGIDVYLGHNEVILSDAGQRTMTLKELVRYVDSCFDQPDATSTRHQFQQLIVPNDDNA